MNIVASGKFNLNLIAEKFTELDNNNIRSISQGMILDNYCDSIIAQPEIDFTGIDGVEDQASKFNGYLYTAQSQAITYKKVLKPAILGVLSDIGTFCDLYKIVPTLNPGDNKEKWLAILNTMYSYASEYSKNAKKVAEDLTQFSVDISKNSTVMDSIVSDLNAVIGGDKGVLNDIKKSLNDINSQISGAIAATVVSAITTLVGIIMAVVGPIVSVITGGTAIPFIIGGVSITAAGAAGTAAAATKLAQLYSNKAFLLTEQIKLSNEITVATGISQGISALSSYADTARDACDNMADTWSWMSSDLENLQTSLYEGIIDTQNLQELFVKVIQGSVDKCSENVGIIKRQLAGISDVEIPENTTISEYLYSIAA
ncbi:HBL/NHE enterotoxin family protein [Rahnella aquatilis]|uniref:HBL/NHE enterotoxin family protein n=1 Tax=Rahnella aquatilis TaxID=34038 RepID=UPI0006485295|nr:HBL/NHE enterotoxin family protein [Rahnella aquatilis]